MTHLRKMMLEELQRRNYSQHTTRYYIRTVVDFARRFRCSPDRLGPQHVREYQAELFQKRKLSPGTVAIRLAALRFFYTKTLHKPWSIAETPYPKRAHHLPTILSQQEVAQLINAAATPFHRRPPTRRRGTRRSPRPRPRRGSTPLPGRRAPCRPRPLLLRGMTACRDCSMFAFCSLETVLI